MMNDDEEVVKALRLREAVQRGFDHIDRGKGTEWTPEHWTEIDRVAKQRIKAGRRPKDDV
ncbi:MAG: hypothetical protein HC828_06035 [Blastochloris sp.]|nr:hypothetical protein [Blastochloris sp.]